MNLSASLMSCKIVKIIFIIAISCSLTSGVGQTSYFVSTTGDDNDNGSQATPWATIQFGCDQLSSGDILNILGGTYSEKIELNVSGAINQMITIRAFENQNVIVDASSFSDDSAIFYAHNKSFYRIEGIHFTNAYHISGSGGVYVHGFGHNIELINCKFSNIAISTDPNIPVNDNTNQPIVSFIGDSSADSLTNILVSGIEIFNCRPGFSECLTIGGNATDFVFINNHIHDNTNIGIDATGNYQVTSVPAFDNARRGLIKDNHCHHNQAPEETAAGIYIDGGHDIIVENNISHHNGYGGEIGCEESGDARKVIFRNNLFYNNKFAGMHLGGYDATTGGLVQDSKVLNNTFYNNDTNNDGNGELLFTQFENGIVRNNIFYISNQNYLMSNDRSQPNLTMDYNLVFSDNGAANIESFWNGVDLMGLSNIYAATGTGQNDVYGDPLFANTVNNDFHLSSDSPAVDAGDPAFAPAPGEVDIDGENRLNNARVDCGADERHLTTNSHIVTAPLDISIYPNPFTDKVVIDGDFSGYEIKVLDVMGITILDYTGTSSPLTIDLGSLGVGIYFISIINTANNQLGIVKMLKQ